MALQANSLFLYGFEVTPLNRSIDFKSQSGGPEIRATLPLGFYSLTTLMNAIAYQMGIADPNGNTYTVSANRNVSGGTQNRVTISTSGAFLSLLFGTGSRVASSVNTLIGFSVADRTGATSYQGVASAGTAMVTQMIGYNYIDPRFQEKVYGAVSVSASGLKEAITFQLQHFFEVQFKFINKTDALNNWKPLLEWLISQKLVEFTPEITSPDTFYEGTLESSSYDGKGLGYLLREMLPEFPFKFDTGVMKFRQRESG